MKQYISFYIFSHQTCCLPHRNKRSLFSITFLETEVSQNKNVCVQHCTQVQHTLIRTHIWKICDASHKDSFLNLKDGKCLQRREQVYFLTDVLCDRSARRSFLAAQNNWKFWAADLQLVDTTQFVQRYWILSYKIGSMKAARQFLRVIKTGKS